MANVEISLEHIHNHFDSLKSILDQEQQHCDNLIRSTREEILTNEDEQSKIELADQLNYFEEETIKTHEENKQCLFSKFQDALRFHQEGALGKVQSILHEIQSTFVYRPSVRENLEKLYAKSKEKTSIKRSFCNRPDIDAFQRQKHDEIFSSVRRPMIESNEIDLTKLIRETSSSQNGSNRFRFSNLSNSHYDQSLKSTSPTENPSTTIYSTRLSCENALLMASSKHYVLLYNIEISNQLYMFDIQTRQIKEQHWDEGAILSVGYVDNHQFYLITPTKVFLYDLIKASIVKQYFLYDSLYKDLLLINNDPSYRTILKRNNQIQSAVLDDYCYYLYLTRDYQQVLVKFSLVDFHPVFRWNLHESFPHVECFLGFTVNHLSLITFLVRQNAQYELIFSDELRRSQPLKQNMLRHVKEPSQILSISLINLTRASKSKRWNYSSKKSHQHLWLILDRMTRSIHCVNYDNIDKQIDFHRNDSLESISIIDQQQLLVAFNPFDIQLIDLDQCLSC